MLSGIVFHTFAKVVFVLSGYIIHYFLGTRLSPDEYGVIGTIITILDFEYLFLNNGVRQAVSNSISQDKYDRLDVFKKGLLCQIVIIFILVLINLIGAKTFSSILNDDRMDTYICYAALIIPFNGIYFVILGAINGVQLFKSEAVLCALYPILKLSVIPFVLFLFSDAILGTEMGFFFAVVVICFMGVFILIIKRKYLISKVKNKINLKIFLKSAFSFSTLFVAVSLILSIDTLILKASSSNSEVVGYYTGAVTFGKVPYYLLQAFYLVILPIVSRKYTEGKLNAAKESLSNLIYIILLFILPISAIVSSSSSMLLESFYGPLYKEGSFALSILVFTNFFMGMFVIFNMMISITEKKSFSSFLAFFMVIADAVLSVILTKLYSLNGTALAGCICVLFGMVISGLYVKNLFGKYLDNKHGIAIIANVLLFVLMRLINNIYGHVNLFDVIIIYCGIYLLFIGLLRIFKVFTFKNIIEIVK